MPQTPDTAKPVSQSSAIYFVKAIIDFCSSFRSIGRVKTRSVDGACHSAVGSAVLGEAARVPRSGRDCRIGSRIGRRMCLEAFQVDLPERSSIARSTVEVLARSPMRTLSSIRSRTLTLEPAAGKHGVIPTIVIARRIIIAAYYRATHSLTAHVLPAYTLSTHHRPIHA